LRSGPNGIGSETIAGFGTLVAGGVVEVARLRVVVDVDELVVGDDEVLDTVVVALLVADVELPAGATACFEPPHPSSAMAATNVTNSPALLATNAHASPLRDAAAAVAIGE
jgi:hypothetical protein